MTSATERVPLDRISQRAHAARPGRTALVAVTAALFGLGWVAYKTCAVMWLAVAWTGAAVAEGWVAAKADSKAGQVRRGTARAG